MALRNDLSAEIKADIINYTSAIDGQAYLVLGNTVRGDSNVRIYYYNASSLDTADGELILPATGMGVGRFIKAQHVSAGAGIGFNPATGQITNTITDNSQLGNGANYLTSASLKKQETFSGTTNASGQYTVTFAVAYAAAPNIQPSIIGGTDTQNIRITSITTTGFTVLVRNRTDVVGLLPSYSNVSGASVDVLITQK